MRKTILSAALAATLLAGGIAFAQTAPEDGPPPPGGPGHMMRDPLLRADANKDGVVTRDELLADVARRFAKMDTNHDGKISPEERQAAFQAMRAERVRAAVGDRGMRDGDVTLDAMEARALKLFDFVDRNGDGKVDKAERDLVRENMMAMRGPGGPGGPGGFGGRRHGPPPPPPPGDEDGPPPPPAGSPNQ
ncbi:ca2+ sensor protein [Sphingomonas sp.]|uniref:ca2+ sensor protein n=1 Tax=Sphingomonas sp. TaxID=28214 RepID=UPI001B171A7F|nr:ca2+ sensor protein [Sphingomonas sp.]MBO9711840.1 ca2+ sensor protein [Sphingomonas sp.]